MTFYANDVHPIPPDHGADDCDDQLPLISRVGRGLKGDSSRIRISDDDSCTETYLEGGYVDNADGTWHSEWVSKNINGGELKYQYNLRPYTIPRTFTITFIYKRPGRHEWSWTTPAIPYIWTLDNAGIPEENPDHIVGSGVATLFIKTVHDQDWNERLNYPIDPDTGEPYPREDFNAPLADEAWASTITFGIGGDVEIPDLDDIAKLIGINKDEIYNFLINNKPTINIGGAEYENLIDYINKQDDEHLKDAIDHLHRDLGFQTPINNKDHTGNAFGTSPITNLSYANVKAYIDAADAAINAKAQKAEAALNAVQNILNKIYTGGTAPTVNPETGVITWPNAVSDNSIKIPMGDLNVFAGEGSPSSTRYSNAIRSRAVSDDDIDFK